MERHPVRSHAWIAGRGHAVPATALARQAPREAVLAEFLVGMAGVFDVIPDHGLSAVRLAGVLDANDLC